MNFLTVSHFFESHGGGIERVAGRVARELAAAGHGSAWAASAADPAPDEQALEIVPLTCANPTERLTGLPMPIPGPAGLRALAAAVARADAVIVHDALYATSIAAMVLARRRGKPVILIQHIASIPFRSALLKGVMALANALVTAPMLKRADQVVFISDTVKRELAHIATRRPPITLFNGVDSAVFHPGPGERAAFGLPPERELVVFAGRFVAKKGLTVLERVARLRPDIAFALAGAGPIDPAAWNLGNVHCLGTLPPDQLATLYRSADRLLLPSVGEGYPLVIQEAMACGLPAVCSIESAAADPAAARFLHGVAIDLGDPEASAQRIVPLLDAAVPMQDREAMAAYARRTYSWPAMAGELATLAAHLINTTRHPAAS